MPASWNDDDGLVPGDGTEGVFENLLYRFLSFCSLNTANTITAYGIVDMAIEYSTNGKMAGFVFRTEQVSYSTRRI